MARRTKKLMTVRWLIAVTAMFVVSGCVQNVRPINEQNSGAFSARSVFYATTRNDTEKADLNKRFGPERTPISFGIDTVAIPSEYPKAHSPSFTHWNLTLARNPEKYLALVNVQPMAQADYFHALTTQAKQSDDPILVFVHGFNTPFERAARISAKLSYDLDLTSPAVLFAWPSNDRPSSYPADEDNLAWSQHYFDGYLADLFEQLPEERFILLAHSMGNRTLIDGLLSVLADDPDKAQQILGVVFAAPDIDADIFRRDLAPPLIRYQLPMTLYASGDDLALYASNQLHKYPRAGYINGDPVILQGIDTVDATEADSELLGHEYFSHGTHTITDIYQWLIEGKAPQERSLLVPEDHANGRYWVIQPPASE